VRTFDVNVLAFAFRSELPQFPVAHQTLTKALSGPSAFGISELVLSGFLRLTTHPNVYNPPSKLEDAPKFVNAILAAPSCTVLHPGPRHWSIFIDLCRSAKCIGNDIPDAYHAALAIEYDCEFITADKGFGKFRGLRWKYLLDPAFKP
jgi:toxin-antitoxin system PIN domain toxin